MKEKKEKDSKQIHEWTALFWIIAMLSMIVLETMAKYQRLRNVYTLRMIRHFRIIGFGMIIYAGYIIIKKMFREKGTGLKGYFVRNPFELVWLMFLGYALAATLCADDRRIAFWGTKYRGTGFVAYLIFAAAYLCGKQLSYGRRVNYRKQILYFLLSAVCVIQNLLFILRELGEYGNKSGAFYNTNHSAYFMVICLFTGIGYMAVADTFIKKIAGTLLYMINVWCLIMNDTFGAYLAVIVGLVILTVLHLIKYRRLKGMVIAALVIFCLMSVLVECRTHIISQNFSVLSMDTKRVYEKKEGAETGGSGRIALWKKTTKYVLKHPLLGCGPDMEIIDDDTGQQLMLPHNEYLQYAMEIGLPAMGLYLVGLVLLIVRCFRKMKETDEGMIYDSASVAGYCFSAFFGVVVFYTAVYFFIMLGLTAADTIDANENTKK